VADGFPFYWGDKTRRGLLNCHNRCPLAGFRLGSFMTRIARLTCVLLFALGFGFIVQGQEPRESNKWKREGNPDAALFIPWEGTFQSIDSLSQAYQDKGTSLQETSTFVFLRHVPITPLLPLFKRRRSRSLECTGCSLINEKRPTTVGEFLYVI
jgi:hypothetical protein